jgi:hypothetical protein
MSKNDSPPRNKACAYCGIAGPFTKEHVFPNWLYNIHPEQNLGFNPKAMRFIKGAPKIGDVCEKCNNEYLSKLDEYAKNFFTLLGLDEHYSPEIPVLINYDYDLLLRWILKICHNASRASAGAVPTLLNNCIPYILYAKNKTRNVYLFVEIISDYNLTEGDKKIVPENIKNLEKLPSQMWRVGNIFASPKTQYVAKFLSMNAYYFYLLLFSDATTTMERESLIWTIKHQIPDMKLLSSRRKQLMTSASKSTLLDRYRYQAISVASYWREYQNSQ